MAQSHHWQIDSDKGVSKQSPILFPHQLATSPLHPGIWRLAATELSHLYDVLPTEYEAEWWDPTATIGNPEGN